MDRLSLPRGKKDANDKQVCDYQETREKRKKKQKHDDAAGGLRRSNQMGPEAPLSKPVKFDLLRPAHHSYKHTNVTFRIPLLHPY